MSTKRNAQPRPAGTTGEAMLVRAIALTLVAPLSERARLFDELLSKIVAAAAAPDSGMRPWVYTAYDGTDGSRIFVSGIGRSIVVDPQGRLWRARTYEDFETTYTITPRSCEIATMTPKYGEMYEYLSSQTGGRLHLVPPSDRLFSQGSGQTIGGARANVDEDQA